MTQLRVAIDATAVPQDLGGVGRYVKELVVALGRTGVDLAVVTSGRDAPTWADAVGDKVEILTAPDLVTVRPARIAWEHVGLAPIVKRWGATVLHSPHYTMPRSSSVRHVVSLLDATFFTSPEVHLRSKRIFFRAAIRRAVRLADALVVPSLATRDEVLREAGGDPARFHLAYLGVDTAVFHPTTAEEISRVKAAIGIPTAQYVAFLGTLEPRKNLPALVRGWASTFAGRPDAPALVLAGGKGWDSELDGAIAAVPADLTVMRTGYLPLGDLPGLLAGASVVAYPSLGEGFGLPVLEAMACGAAVLTTDRLSLPEVGGDAVAYTDTDDASIGAALAALLADGDRRESLRRSAIQRAASFTWDACAAAHLAAYEAAVARPRD